jgi:polysaccharide biosynthesis protein PslG
MNRIEATSQVRWAWAVSALIALTGLFALTAAAGADDDPKYTDDRLKKMVKNELRDLGLSPKGVSSCRPKLGGKVLVCKWRAKGLWPGEVAYECKGKAKLVVRGKKWKIDPCINLIEPMVPLLPFPGPHPTFGYNEDWHHQPGKLDMLAGGGGEIARTGMFWDAVEPQNPTQRNWPTFDSLYSQMLARGIRPLWVLQAAPCWAQPGSCDPGSHPAPEYYDEFAQFAVRVAQRYPQSLGLEVWNEPNYRPYWHGDPDPDAYGQMFDVVESAVHQAVPQMTVITAGLSPNINNDNDAMAYEGFLRQAYATGGLGGADAIGAHPYPNRRYSEDYLGNIRINLYRYLRAMNEFGDGGKPIWVTETGTSTEGDDGMNAEQQADALAKMYTQFRRIENIPVVIFHRFMDQPGASKINERGFGVVNGDGDPKPSYCSVAAAREHPC